MRRRLIWIIFTILVVVVGIGGASYYTYEQATYVTTNNAQVAVDTTTITAPSTGVLSRWNIHTGDAVSASEKVGEEYSYTLSTRARATTATSTSAMNQRKPGLVKKYTSFVVPQGGTVLIADATQGQVVEASQPLAVVGDLSKAYVVAMVKETDISHVSVGALVDVSVDAVPGLTLNGSVERIGNSAGLVLNPTEQLEQTANSSQPTQWVPVKIRVDFQGQYVVPGMNATVKIHR